MGHVDDVVILMKNLFYQLLEVWVDLNEVHFVLFENVERYGIFIQAIGWSIKFRVYIIHTCNMSYISLYVHVH